MTSSPSVTGDTILEAQFDPKIMSYTRAIVSMFLFVTVVGILIIPFWLLFSRWYCPEYLRRASARLTTQAVEVRKGVQPIRGYHSSQPNHRRSTPRRPCYALLRGERREVGNRPDSRGTQAAKGTLSA